MAMAQPKQRTMIHDIVYKKHMPLSTSASDASCYVCGKGIEDGHSITAKTLRNGTVLFCDVHYSFTM